MTPLQNKSALEDTSEDSNDNMEVFIVHGHGGSQRNAIDKMVKVIDDIFITKPTLKGSDIWIAYKNRKLGSASNKASLYFAVFNKENTNRNLTWQDIFLSAFKEMSMNIPVIKEVIALEPSGDGSGLQLTINKNPWTVVSRKSPNRTILNTSQLSNTITSDEDNDDSSVVSMTEYVTKVKESSNNKDKNTYATLGDFLEDDIEEVDTSHDMSSSTPRSESNPEDISNRNNGKPNMAHQFKVDLTEEQIHEIEESLNNGKIDNVNIDLLCKWILDSKYSVQHMMTSMNLTTHDWTQWREETIKKASDSALNTFHRHRDKSVNTIENAGSNNVSLINRTANGHLDNIKTVIKDSEDVLDKLTGYKAIATAATEALDTISNSITTRLNTAYMEMELKATNLEQSVIDEICAARADFFARIEESNLKQVEEKYQQQIDALQKEKENYLKDKAIQKADMEELKLILNEAKATLQQIKNGKPDIKEENTNDDTEDTDEYKNDDDGDNDGNNTHGANRNGVLPPPLPPCTKVRFKQNIQNYIAFIIQPKGPPLWSNRIGNYEYDIITASGTTIFGCNGNYIHPFEDMPGSQPRREPLLVEQLLLKLGNNGSQSPSNKNLGSHRHDVIDIEEIDTNDNSANDDDSNSDVMEARMRHQYYNKSPTSQYSQTRIPRQDEFQYPHGAPPKSVNSYILTKYGRDWTELTVSGPDDIRSFFEKFSSRVHEANIYCLNYDDITMDSGIAAITKDNCVNFDYAYKAMSNAIFHLIDRNKEEMFKQYKEPLTYLPTFRPNLDGFGFLFELISHSHPVLKRAKIAQMSPLEIPQFRHFISINEFINAYRLWEKDELLQNRQYSDKDKIEHIIYSLDDRFQIAKDKILRQLELIFLDPLKPQPFPESLKLTPQLAITITNMIPRSKYTLEELMNDNPEPRLHISELRNKGGSSPSIYKTFDKQRIKERRLRGSDNSSHNWSQWKDKIKFRPMPVGTICEACGKPNHCVYETGCSALGTFMMCTEFFKTQPKEKLDMVLSSYKQYQEDRSKARKERIENDKTLLNLFKKEKSGKKFSKIKRTYVKKFYDDFPDAYHDNDSPYDDDDKENTPNTTYEHDSDSEQSNCSSDSEE